MAYLFKLKWLFVAMRRSQESLDPSCANFPHRQKFVAPVRGSTLDRHVHIDARCNLIGSLLA